MNKEHYADYKWIKVKRYVDDESKSWEERYKSLDSHHLKETTFLIDEVRSLADRLDAFEIDADRVAKEQEKVIAQAKQTKDRQDIIQSFIVLWFGGALSIAYIFDWLVDKEIKLAYSNWFFFGSLLIGGLLALWIARSKWKREHAKQ